MTFQSNNHTSQGSDPSWCTVCNEKPVKHFRPAYLCDGCWSDRYGMQNVGGVLKPFKEHLKDILIRKGLYIEDGETTEEYHNKMELEGRSILQRLIGRKTGKVVVHKGPP